MSACTSGIEQKFFRDGLFFILANTPLGVVRRMEESRRPDMGGGGKGEPPEVRGERVISEVVERPNILFLWYAEWYAPHDSRKKIGIQS
jgi:hypothetical protein